MTENKTLDQNAELINTVDAHAHFESNTVSFASGRVAATNGYGEQSKGFSEILGMNNSLPPTPEYGVER